MKLSIIIVSWNVKDKLRKNLQSIFQSQVDFDFDVFVVDNNSKDASPDMIKSEFPEVKLIQNNDNLGFAKANNQAIKKSFSQYVLLLNPDMLVMPDTLQNMMNWIEANSQAWVAGCKLVSENNKIIRHVRRFPRLWDQALIVLKIPHFLPSALDGYIRSDFNYELDGEVDSIRGGFFLINLNNFTEMPLLDERYFLWFEEVDFCKTVKQRGGKIFYTPSATCIDYVGQSFEQVSRFETQKLFRNSMLKYFKKWHGYLPFSILYVLWAPMLLLARITSFFNLKRSANT